MRQDNSSYHAFIVSRLSLGDGSSTLSDGYENKLNISRAFWHIFAGICFSRCFATQNSLWRWNFLL